MNPLRLPAIAITLTFAIGQLVIGSGGVRADVNAEHPYPISSSLSPGVRAFLTLESSSGVFNIEHHYGRVVPAPDGAYLNNVTAPPSAWYIEDQRYGDVDVIGGILHDNPALVKTGLRMFDFGIDREAAGGSFPGSFGLFHGTAMFLAQAGPALLLLTHWSRERSLGVTMVRHVRWEIGRMRTAAHHLIEQWWRKPGHIDDGGKEERFFEASLALESIGLLTGDRQLETSAGVYAHEGIRMTRGNGVWTENGGHDSSYQAIGLVYGARYLALLGTAAPSRAMHKALAVGEAWELSRVHRDGSIDRNGDDRTGPTCPERDASGTCKTVDLIAVAGALMRWGVMDHEVPYERRAYQVWLQNWKRMPGDVLPAPAMFVKPAGMTVKEIGYGWPLWVGATRFQPLERVRIYFGKILVGTATCDQIGSFGGHSPISAVKFTLPSGTQPGVYTLRAQGGYGTRRHTQVTITG